MAFLSDKKYSFVSSALSSDTFAVVDVHGEEGLSRCYRFEVTLVTDEAEIDLGRVVQDPAVFTIHRGQEDDVDFHGVLARFEQLHEVDGYVFYRAVLVPKLWWLTLTHHNQVFLNQSVQDLVEAVLKDGGLTNLDFEFRLQGRYPKQSYVCQYGETHFNFMSRWLEREGIYYFFEQTPAGEKIVFTDTAISHTESPKGGSLSYSPPSGLGDARRDELVQGLVGRYNTLPQKIRLRDYNYRKPSLEMTGTALVDERGRGEIYYYGEHFPSPEEGNRLAGIRAQELLCRKEEFVGDSTVPYVQPGYTFTLQGHYRDSFNQKYLCVEMTHEGSQTGYLISGIAKALADREKTVFYRNQFTAIPSSTQFRPTRTADQPKITGTLNAKIDAAGSGQYAELDDQGRYKVILPFDLSGRENGKASTWLRMVQPYAGSNHGMHFPLHKGTEVLLSFIEGNPDRPVIAGAAPNPETPSPVTSTDQTMAKITTSGGNKIHMEDKEGTQRILLHSPTAQTFLRLGAHNDPDDHEDKWGAHKKENLYGAALVSEAGLKIEAGFKNELIMIEETLTVLGLHMKNIIGMAVDLNIGGTKDIKLLYHNEFKPTRKCLNPEKKEVNLDSTKMIANETNIKDQVTTLSNEMTTVIVEREEVIDEEITVVAEAQEIANGSTRITEELQSLIGEANTIAGTITTIAGSLTEISNEKTELNTSVSRLDADVTEIHANRDELSEAINQLAGEKNVISGLINLM
jgi:type VI secretion system secreted protein VgrG